MTEKEALKLALEALKYPLNQSHENFNVDMAELLAHRAITAIKEALAQQDVRDEIDRGAKTLRETYLAKPEHEQSGFFSREAMKAHSDFHVAQPEQELVCVCGAVWEGQELVSTPPQRTWVGLTDDEIMDIYNEPRSDAEMIAFGREVEAKLKEKNA